MTIDHPKVRADRTCPLCDKGKDVGLVCCWACYGLYGLRFRNPKAAAIIDRREAVLAVGAEGRAA
jgi:hypothetical protein